MSLANAPLTFLDGEVLNEEEIPETMSLIEEDGIMTVSQLSPESKNFNQTQSIESDKTERQPEVVSDCRQRGS